MDFTTKELLKRYAKLAIGQPFAPVLLNILVTSVCDMRCTHCFFTDELDDRPRKKLQMKTHEIEKISKTLGGNLGVLILAGGEPFTRKDLPEIARAFYTNNKLESIYIMSNGQIQKRIFPDVTRILEAIEQGEPKAAEQLLPLVYGELRRLAAHKMANEASGHTLQPTALASRCYGGWLLPPVQDRSCLHTG